MSDIFWIIPPTCVDGGFLCSCLVSEGDEVMGTISFTNTSLVSSV